MTDNKDKHTYTTNFLRLILLKMLGLYLDTLIIGHKLCSIISILKDFNYLVLSIDLNW